MRNRLELLALALVLVFIIAMTAISQRDDYGSVKDKNGQQSNALAASSYRTYPSGYKALYLTMQQLGFPVQRQIRPYALLPAHGLLIVADPGKDAQTSVSAPTVYEGRKLVEWVRQGNYALIGVEANSEFLRDLAWKAPSEDLHTPTTQNVQPTPKPPVDDWSLVKFTESVQTLAPLSASGITWPLPPLTIKSGVRFPTASILPKQLLQLVGGAVPLYRDPSGVVVFYSKIGRGGIIWNCSPWSFSNDGLAQGENLDFVLAWANQHPGAPIIFDEYHQGYGAGMGMWQLAPSLTKLGILQVCVALLLILSTLAWRFGPPRLPVEERYTRSRAEYLTSMAALLHRARATHMVRNQLGARVRREICRRLGIPPQSATDQMLAAHRAHPVVDHAALTQVCDQYAALEAQAHPSEEALLRYAHEVHRLLRQNKG
jgi:hypothetical protein